MASELEVGKVSTVTTNAGGDVTALQLRNGASNNSTSTSLRFVNSAATGTTAGGSEISSVRLNANGGAKLVIKTANDVNAGLDERLTISSTGETKITRAGDEPCLELSTTNAGCKLNFSRNGDPTAYIRMYEDGAVGTGSLRFATGSSATPVERLTINSSGLATFSAGVVTSEKGVLSGSVTVADDAVTTITPKRKGGFISILVDTAAGDGNYPVKSDSTQIWFDVGASTNIQKLDIGTSLGSQVETTTSNLTGTTGTDGVITVGVQSGTIQIENRRGANRTFNYTITC